MTDKKSDLDLDFGDIAGQKQAPPPKPDPEPEQEVASERLGITLAFPAGGRKFICKEIEDCTGEEFLLWAKFVGYNFTKDPDPAEFDRLKIRIRAFKKIEAFHKRLTFAIPGLLLPK